MTARSALSKPRNPFVPASHLRVAGVHRRSNQALRQHAKSELRRQLQHERERYPDV